MLCNLQDGALRLLSSNRASATPVLQYIHDLVARCDKSGDVQTIAILREDRDALQRRVEELETELNQTQQRQGGSDK